MSYVAAGGGIAKGTKSTRQAFIISIIEDELEANLRAVEIFRLVDSYDQLSYLDLICNLPEACSN